MHTHDTDAAVDDLHSVEAHDIGNCAAAAKVNLAKFGQLVVNIIAIHNAAQFAEILNNVAEKGTPHLLCSYLYDLAGLFSSFYENCPILTADDEAQKQSRLRLAALAGRTLKQGLELLGLETLERM